MALFPESMMTRPAFQPFRFAVVGCGAKKADKLSVASELYLGDLFQKSYAHARREHGEHVLILSAHYGLLNPHTVVHPYDLQLGDLDGEARAKLGETPGGGVGATLQATALGRYLLYGTGGLAFGSLKVQTPGGFSESSTSAGWTIGAGAEFAINQNWSAKVEYLYVDLKDTDFSATLAVPDPAFDVTGTVHDKNRFSVVRAGVNYKF